MNFKSPILILTCFLLIFWSADAIPLKFHSIEKEKREIEKLIRQQFPDCKIADLKNEEGFKFVLEVNLLQKVDHHNADSEKFYQKIYLYHKSRKKPNVLVTEGYAIRDNVYEPTRIFDANQISVEFRYSGSSTPKVLDWKFLKQEQALLDLNEIQKRFSKIYKNKWISTGISKGGTTSILYSLTFPKNLSAVVAYVATFALAQEDFRTIDHYRNKVSTPECRAKVFEFQKQIFNQRDELKLLIDTLAITEQVEFPLGIEKTIEYAALEYPFSFWQWGFGCSEIPESSATAREIFEHLEETVDINLYDDKNCAYYLPAYYQNMTELGYYGFDTVGLSTYLKLEKNPSNLIFCPKDIPIIYDPSYMRMMHEKAVHQGHHILYIYGEMDTWTSCGVVPDKNLDAARFEMKGGNHRTRIRNFSVEEKTQIYQHLQRWTHLKTRPLPF
ncbi:MAG: hypothetical protein IPO72_10215 [Saprospiraceae bacterium]|nr:hypothetical protein [Candidatus Vicinibacter affinis]